MRYHRGRHQHRQHVLAAALLRQDLVALDTDDLEDLAWSLADATASMRGRDATRRALVAELRLGDGEEVGDDNVRPLVDVLLAAISADPEPPAGSDTLAPTGWLVRRREARADTRGRWFTITPWGFSDGDPAVLRAALDAVRPWADQLQTDLPLAQRDEWPAEVSEAAGHLHAVSPRHRGDTAHYATTGWLTAHDEATWTAFVRFAPYALDADVLTDRARTLVGLADEAASVALRLDVQQQAAVEAALSGRSLRRIG